MQILTNVGMTNMTQMTLRARTIEAMGYMIEAVQNDKDSFKGQVAEITKTLVQLLNSGLTNDDPQTLAIKETLAKTAAVLKEEFHVFMPTLMTSLVNDAKLDIDIKMGQAEDPLTGKNDQTTSVTFKLKGLEGNQRISMNTSALESKISAFKLVHMIADNMGASFTPYVEHLLPLMVEYMNYMFSKAIRKSAMKTLNCILTAVGKPNNVTIFMSLYANFSTMI